MISLRILVFCAFVVCKALVVEEICETPLATAGLCVNLQECPSIYAMSTDFGSQLTLDRLNFLIRSQCGYLGNNPKVCCPATEVAR
ncbi:unnamed protein product [Phaedon cochleariae]|uniref:Clip domain-containing protein n=1 Tax=Phaedon cochleariae TaxID=80249 RepID=A0A9P0DMR7_PHACE|nr:unnamed protein product [Phaedon cochleariae]